MTFLRVIFLLTFFSTPVFSQWFWEEHYYEIPSGGEKYYAKGKPRIEGEFTVFNKWPENLEWRIKTQHVKAIKDIGPDSPEVLKAKANAASAKANAEQYGLQFEYVQESPHAEEHSKANAEQYNLLSIFKPLLSLNDKSKFISLNELKTARDRGYSDGQIWSVLKGQSQLYSEAEKSGFTLDAIAKFLDQKAKE